MKKLLLLPLLIYSCAPKMVVNTPSAGSAIIQTKPYESFATIESDTVGLAGQKFIAELEIKDAGLSVNCDYETVKRLAEEKARKLGGNCLLITDHKEPDRWSACHRIKGKVLRIDQPELFEKQILWHRERPLKIVDFKGSVEKRPFLAATYSGIRYQATAVPFSGKAKILVETTFDCDLSYFKHSESDSATLAHEQLHFDISEIYARKFRKEILEHTPNYKTFEAKHQAMFASIQRELAVKQDEYDSEVYVNPALQPKWSAWVETELAKLEAYKNQEMLLKLR